MAETLRGVVSQVLCRRIEGGWVAAFEVLLTIPEVAALIREGKTFQIPSVMQANRSVGMVTLTDALLELVDSKQIDPREAYLGAADKAGITAALEANNITLASPGEG